MPDSVSVNSMFARIAGRYDLANRLLSGGIDRRWRRHLVRAVSRAKPRDVLDLATGSGDVAFALARHLPVETRIVGMDFCQPMLDEAVKKQRAQAGVSRIEFRQGDGLALPLAAESVDAVTISFGLRNMADRHRSLTEMHRVLRSGGRLFVLEFSQPVRGFRPFYLFYLRRVLPSLAGWLTGDRAAYRYLNETIELFPGPAGLAAEIRAAGFSAVHARRLSLGIVALHEATK
ncbi:MAG TPA: bifunctional demethylmenaquinone methyltransferase/2-methoxy-6-polyprenyl-1,4-benzoquinol methylase UbiE [Opitutus sp.]|nr:bifunctional demethylmenaquinone methyltransferase/2-methoxy-6-polyprenyl-1,4-benzoquinol methylase UbiE [Opitutus sp.]